MMVAFYRHAGRMWPGIALSCSLGNIAASILLFHQLAEHDLDDHQYC